MSESGDAGGSLVFPSRPTQPPWQGALGELHAAWWGRHPLLCHCSKAPACLGCQSHRYRHLRSWESRFAPPCPNRKILVLGPTLHLNSATRRNPKVRTALTLCHYLNSSPPCGGARKKRPEIPKLDGLFPVCHCLHAGSYNFLYFFPCPKEHGCFQVPEQLGVLGELLCMLGAAPVLSCLAGCGAGELLRGTRPMVFPGHPGIKEQDLSMAGIRVETALGELPRYPEVTSLVFFLFC